MALVSGRRPRTPWTVGAAAGLALAVSSGVAYAPPARADGATCGSQDNPCPLQKWMRAHVGRPMNAQDLGAVARGLDAAAALVPDPSWSAWAPIAQKGAAAARRGDAVATKATCKECHDKYKDDYRAKFRTRPVP